MKKIAFIIVSLCFSTIVSGKVKNDTLAAYKALIAKIKTSPSRNPFNVETSTSKSASFNNFEFFVDLDYKGTAIRARENWKNFVSQIDTTMNKDFKLATRGKPWFGRINPKRTHTITFSPVIFNSDKTLALVNVTFNSEYKMSQFNEYEMSEIIYYLEKDNDGKWKVIHGWMHLQT